MLDNGSQHWSHCISGNRELTVGWATASDLTSSDTPPPKSSTAFPACTPSRNHVLKHVSLWGTFYIQTPPRVWGGRRTRRSKYSVHSYQCVFINIPATLTSTRLGMLPASRTLSVPSSLLSCYPALKGHHHPNFHHLGSAMPALERPVSETVPSVLTGR